MLAELLVAAAHLFCLPHAVMLESLEAAVGETVVARGTVTAEGKPAELEVLASPSGSFTMIFTGRSGNSCVGAIGEGWQLVPPGEPA